MNIRGLIVVVPVVLAGCAQLSIDVNAYRGPMPIAWERAESVSGQVLDLTTTEAKAAHKKRVYENNGLPTDKGKQRQKIEEAWADVDASMDGIRLAADTMLREMAGARHAAKLDQRLSSKFSAIGAAYGIYKHRMKTFAETAKKECEAEKGFCSVAQAPQSSHSPLRIAGGIASDGETSGREVGTPMFDNNIRLLSQQDDDWVPFSSNHFDGYFGDTQFVVVREGQLVYHQKSLDFDPTAAVGAGTAITRLGLKVGAALATGQTPVPAGASASEPLATVSAQLDQMEENKEYLARVEAARRQFLRNVVRILESSATADEWQQQLSAEVSAYRLLTQPVTPGSE